MADADSIVRQVISLFGPNLPDKIGDTVSQFNIQQHILIFLQLTIVFSFYSLNLNNCMNE